MGVLVVVSGPPLPGRGALARALRRRLGARHVEAAAGEALAWQAALAGGGCVVVEADLAGVAERRRLRQRAGVQAQCWVEWTCGRALAEREIFHRYASRPPSVAAAELSRYEEDARARQPMDDEVPAGEWVRVAAELPLDVQLAAVLGRLPRECAARERPARAPRVMVVEDDADQRAILAEVLAELGCAVEPAASGDEALARLQAGAAIDVLISDQRMPGMSGIELTRALADRHPEVRAILLTAFGDEQTVRSALQARAVTVLAKPVRVVDLERVLDEARL